MKEDSVTISLLRYHRLKDAEKVSKDEADSMIDFKVDKELLKLRKSNILLETKSDRMLGFYVTSKHIITDSEAVEKIGDELKKLQDTIDEKVDQAEKEKRKYQLAYQELKAKKWYEFL